MPVWFWEEWGQGQKCGFIIFNVVIIIKNFGCRGVGGCYERISTVAAGSFRCIVGCWTEGVKTAESLLNRKMDSLYPLLIIKKRNKKI